MSQQSEERLPETKAGETPGDGASSSEAGSARILPFSRPQSDLQRAIQLRAQEAIDRDLARDREARRPRPLKRILILLIALIPVLLIFGAVDGFLRVFYRLNETYSTQPATSAPQPAAQPEEPIQQEPGVVLLQQYPAPVQQDQQAPAAKPPQDTPAN
jgi:hypothetical protein